MILAVAAAGLFILSRKQSMSGIFGSDDPYGDYDAAKELELYIDNNGDLYRSRTRPILQNLTRKYKKGNYDVEKAAKLFMYLVEDGMKRYYREFGGSGGWNRMLSVRDRKKLAREYAEYWLEEFKLGNYVE